VWTSSAFAALDKIYGSTSTPSALKKDFLLPSSLVSNADIGRLINSSEVQAVVRPTKGGRVTKRISVQKKNPLENKQVLLRLNPYAAGYRKDHMGHQKVDSANERAGENFSKAMKEA
jgi:large subunit ribosomal protein L4e